MSGFRVRALEYQHSGFGVPEFGFWGTRMVKSSGFGVLNIGLWGTKTVASRCHISLFSAVNNVS